MKYRMLALFALLAFSAYTAWVVFTQGYIAVFRVSFSHPASTQPFIDLGIACGLCAIWILADARRRNVRAWPFLLLTLILGSIGPLLYLVIYPPWEQRIGPASDL